MAEKPPVNESRGGTQWVPPRSQRTRISGPSSRINPVQHAPPRRELKHHLVHSTV
nr:MAG TPA: hypothetical protein [Caudoviricetes sp.]